MLSIFCQDKERNWDLQLPFVMVAYRTSVQESTGATPFSLMFGREAKLPVDIMFGCPPNTPPVPACEYSLQLRSRLEHSYHLVRSHLNLQQRRQKNLYDKRCCGAHTTKEIWSGFMSPLSPEVKHQSFIVPGRAPIE